jgi:hypothetical protein
VAALALLAVNRFIKQRGTALQGPINKPSSSGASGWVATDSNRYISSGGASNASGLCDGKAHISSQGLVSTGTGSTTNMLSTYTDSPRQADATHVTPSPSAASLGGITAEVEGLLEVSRSAADTCSPAATVVDPSRSTDSQKLTERVAQRPASNHQHSRPASYVLPASAARLLHYPAPTQGVEQVYEALQHQEGSRDDKQGSLFCESLAASTGSSAGAQAQSKTQGLSSPLMNRVQQLALIEQELRSMCLSLHGSQRNAGNQAVSHSHTVSAASAAETDTAPGNPSQQSQQSSNSKGGSTQHGTGSDSGNITPSSSNTGEGSSSAMTTAPSADTALVDHIPGLKLLSTLGSVSVMLYALKLRMTTRQVLHMPTGKHK